MATTYIEIPQEGGGGGGAVDSVNGQTGIVTLDTDDIPEGSSNEYYTDAKARAALSGTAPIDYTSATGVIAIDQAGAAQDGYLSSTDWNTFNDKEGPIAPGAVTDYYRGDKTFQPLVVAAITAVTSGAAAASGTIGEVLTATQAANTSTGVGATGVYGNVTSVSLTAGAWLVYGSARFAENAAVLTTGLQCGISDSASGVGLSDFDSALWPGLLSSTSDLVQQTPPVFVNISSTTTYYLNTKFFYTSGTPQHSGKITAWRIR